MGNNTVEISVIVPTLNRCEILAGALNSICIQSFPSDHYEIIAADNGSSDGTRELVERLNQVHRRRIRYLYEGQLGLHYARHAGARLAKGEILVFTDDDATVDPGWLQAYDTAFAEHPEMVAAGGPVRPVWEVPPPEWLLHFIGDAKTFGPLSLMEPHDEFRLDTQESFFGVNMAIRRDILFAVGGFNPELIGSFTVGDGESGLNRKLQERGCLIGYVPDALVYHHIPAARMTLEHLCRWQAHLAGAQLYSRYHRHMPSPLKLAVDAARTLLSFAGTSILARYVRTRTNNIAVSLKLRAALESARLRYILRLASDPDFRQMVAHKDWLNLFPTTAETKR
jgi:glycosyltransferase involved in cell wall biosynthesis